ncbi:MAG TPA: hypothetical protein VNZ52_14535, partial [Candidatus Thermoplasmatota archaeon]|nr:hypothetical protein [Candidatus Thermoplasmatota archaeon]
NEPVLDALPGKAPIQCIRAPCELAPEDPNYVPADGEQMGGICVIGVKSPCNAPEYQGEEDGQVGICVIGVKSPCNGDADGEQVKDGPEAGDQIWCITDPCELPPESGEDQRVGVCVVGVDSPCNGDEQPDASKDPNTVPEGEPLFGICAIGFDSPCNGEEYGAGYEAPAQEKRAPDAAPEEGVDDGRVY